MMGMGLGLPRGFNFVAAAQQMIKRADYGAGAAVAFSLDSVSDTYSGNLLLVRRSSNGNQLGFTKDQITDGTLVNFCNTEVNKYTSDFSVSEDLNEIAGTGAAAQSIGGVNDAYSFTLTGGATPHNIRLQGKTLDPSQQYRINFDIYIPSSNATTTAFSLSNVETGAIPDTVPQADTWVSYQSLITDFNNEIRIAPSNGVTNNYSGDGDVIYLKNIVVTQLTSDGHVVTWYGQRNGINATQGTATAQPRIVIAGALVTENGKPAIDFDGVNDNLNVTFGSTIPQPIHHFVVHRFTTTPAAFSGILGSTTLEHRLIVGASPNLSYTIQAGGGRTYNNSNQNQNLISTRIQAGNTELAVNSVVQAGSGTIGTNGRNNLNIGSLNLTSGYAKQKIQEVILFQADMSADRAEIEDQINQHYTIY